MRTAQLLVLMAVGVPTTAMAQELSYTGSLSAATGSYIFTESTTTFALYNGLTLNAGPLRLAGGLSLLLQNSGAITAVGRTYLPTGGKDHRAVSGRRKGEAVPMGTRGGHGGSIGAGVAAAISPDSVVDEPGPYELSVGDPLVTGALSVYRGSGLMRSLELTGAVKPPLNSLDSGIGTGEWDGALGAAVALGGARVVLFGDCSYWWYGDLPGLVLRDGLSVGAGLGVMVTRTVWLSGTAALGNRIMATADPPRSAVLGISYFARRSGVFSLTGGIGLSETAPDMTASLGWSRSLNPPERSIP